jgi:hypothetical protein
MKIRYGFLVALFVALVGSILLQQNAEQPFFHDNSLFETPMYAQVNPIPSQVPVFGAAVITGSTTSAGLAAPAANLRYYINQAHCINVSASTVVAGGIIDGNGSTPKLWIPCPAAGAASQPITFNPPLQITAGSQLAFATGTAVQQVFIWVTGYRAR